MKLDTIDSDGKDDSVVENKGQNLNMIKCDYCDYKTSRKNTLSQHYSLKHKNEKLSCPDCEYSGDSRCMISHKKTWDKHSPVQCTECDEKLNTKHMHLDHLKQIHKKSCFCDFCKRSVLDEIKHRCAGVKQHKQIRKIDKKNKKAALKASHDSLIIDNKLQVPIIEKVDNKLQVPIIEKVPVDEYVEKYYPDRIQVKVKGDGGCLPRAVCVPLFSDDSQWTLLSRAINKFIMLDWTNLKSFHVFPLTVIVQGMEKTFDTENDFLSFLQEDMSIYMWRGENDIRALAKILKMKITVIILNENKDVERIHEVPPPYGDQINEHDDRIVIINTSDHYYPLTRPVVTVDNELLQMVEKYIDDNHDVTEHEGGDREDADNDDVTDNDDFAEHNDDNHDVTEHEGGDREDADNDDVTDNDGNDKEDENHDNDVVTDNHDDVPTHHVYSPWLSNPWVPRDPHQYVLDLEEFIKILKIHERKIYFKMKINNTKKHIENLTLILAFVKKGGVKSKDYYSVSPKWDISIGRHGVFKHFSEMQDKKNLIPEVNSAFEKLRKSITEYFGQDTMTKTNDCYYCQPRNDNQFSVPIDIAARVQRLNACHCKPGIWCLLHHGRILYNVTEICQPCIDGMERKFKFREQLEANRNNREIKKAKRKRGEYITHRSQARKKLRLDQELLEKENEAEAAGEALGGAEAAGEALGGAEAAGEALGGVEAALKANSHQQEATMVEEENEVVNSFSPVFRSINI